MDNDRIVVNYKVVIIAERLKRRNSPTKNNQLSCDLIIVLENVGNFEILLSLLEGGRGDLRIDTQASP